MMIQMAMQSERNIAWWFHVLLGLVSPLVDKGNNLIIQITMLLEAIVLL